MGFLAVLTGIFLFSGCGKTEKSGASSGTEERFPVDIVVECEEGTDLDSLFYAEALNAVRLPETEKKAELTEENDAKVFVFHEELPSGGEFVLYRDDADMIEFYFTMGDLTDTKNREKRFFLKPGEDGRLVIKTEP